MKLLTKKLSVVQTSNGRAFAVTIPMPFAREMGIEKGEEIECTFNPKENSVTYTATQYCPCGNPVTSDYGICSDPKCK